MIWTHMLSVRPKFHFSVKFQGFRGKLLTLTELIYFRFHF